MRTEEKSIGKYIVFNIKNNRHAFPLDFTRKFMLPNKVINSTFVEFEGKTYFVENYFNLNEYDRKIVVILKTRAIYLPEVQVLDFSKIIEYNEDFSFAIEESELILVYRRLNL